MNIENLRMENNKDSINSSSSRLKGSSPRVKAAGIFSAAVMFLSGCADRITGQTQDNDNQSIPPQVNVENPPQITEENSIPAIIPTEENQDIISIESSSYPTNADNLIIDTRTNEEKMALIRSWAPNDVEKEIDLYNKEFERMGINLSNIEYRTSIVDGKSWTLYPYNKNTQKGYIVSINNIIRPSIDLFGYLDRDINDDFFDLKEVNISNGQVIGDQSGWHVFAYISDGKVNNYYDANKDEIINVENINNTSTETDTNKIRFITQENIKQMYETGNSYLPEVTRISFDELFSESIQDAENKWLEENPFSSTVVPMKFKIYPQTFLAAFDNDKINNDEVTVEIITLENNDPTINYQNNPEKRPIKIINHYVLWDEDFFEKTEYFKLIENYYNDAISDPIKLQQQMEILEEQKEKKYPFIGIVSYAIYNIDGTVSKIYAMTPDDFFNYYIYDIKHEVSRDGKRITWEEDIIPGFIPNIELKKYDDYMASLYVIPKLFWINYPELLPTSSVLDQWQKTNIVPKELSTKVFSLAYHFKNPWP